jgi:hypothetical protein
VKTRCNLAESSKEDYGSKKGCHASEDEAEGNKIFTLKEEMTSLDDYS